MPLSNSTLFYELLGPYSTRAEIMAYDPGLSVNGGGAGYVSRFETPLATPVQHGEPWLVDTYGFGTTGSDPSSAASIGQYDPMAMEYAWYAMTGDSAYLTKANSYAVSWRDNYLLPNDYKIANWLIAARGMALHYAATGDIDSRDALGGLSRYAYNAWLSAAPSTPAETFTSPIDQRNQARMLECFIYASVVGASTTVPVPGYASTALDYAALALTALNKILGAQHTDGAWRSSESFLLISGSTAATQVLDPSTLVCQPFYSWLIWNALADYDRLMGGDTRIWTAIESCATYHFTSTAYGSTYGGLYNFDPVPAFPEYNFGSDQDFATGIWHPLSNKESCYYTEADKGYTGVEDPIIKSTIPQPWLNGFMLPAIAHLYQVTGGTIWKTRADLLLNGMQSGDFGSLAWRPFQEMYSWSWRAFPDLLANPSTRTIRLRGV